MQSKKPKNGVKIKPKSKEHYVNSKEFKEAIAEYYKTEVCSEELGEMITKIAKGLSYAPNFINYSYKDEMIGDAVVKMFTALFNKKFNLEATDSEGKKYNPFSSPVIERQLSSIGPPQVPVDSRAPVSFLQYVIAASESPDIICPTV